MEQALTGLFQRVRGLPHTVADDEWINQFERGIRDGWVDLLAALQTRKEMNRKASGQMDLVLGGLAELVELVQPEDRQRAFEIVDDLNEQLKKVGENE